MTREEQIFSEALGLSGDARRAYLDRACGDDRELREGVEALLEAHASADRFLEKSPSDQIFAAVEPQPGERIGPYVIVSKIGEGGCGLVFLAEQEEPLRRRVALKVIKPGMDSRQVIARFEAERQALAQMEHPDIARVFDAGATPAGHPYFAMEYVDGVPITRYCDETELPLTTRLELFERICLALQHAHQKAIVHRDVKPSNILVAVHDGRPAPKIIDFGIAKATQARLTDATLLTGFEQFLGTPAYMSPEQAERRDLDIDTRSDIYSLGVLLYELLAGRPPFDPKSLVRAGVEEIRRIVREVDPPRPSTVVSTLSGADRTTIAQQRHIDPASLTRTLRGELDWIVMRCLEKERDRRYGTAQELAEEIRRHLRSEPVNARPPGGLYRARKFVSRHRLACASAAALALAISAGAVVSTWQAIRATRAERDAVRRQEQAEALLTFMLRDFRDELKKTGQLPLLEKVGDKAMAYFDSVESRDLTDVALTREAEALIQIGEVRLDQARYPAALASFHSAHRRAAELVARHPRDAEMLFQRAQAEYWIGSAARRRGDFAVARTWFSHYRDSALALVALEGRTERAELETAYAHHNLAVLDIDNLDLASAKTGFQAERAALGQRLAGAPEDVRLLGKLADNDVWLGLVAERDGDYEQALQHTMAGASAFARIGAREPKVANWKFRLANCLGFSGDIQGLTGHRDAAAASYRDAVNLLESLVARDPGNARWELALQNMRLCQAQLLLAAAQYAEADALIGPSREKFEVRMKVEPTSRLNRVGMATACRLAGTLRLIAGRIEPEIPALRACALGEELVQESRADNRVLHEYAAACLLAGRVARAQGRESDAQKRWQQVLDVLAPRLAQTRDWRLLDPAAQALALKGEQEPARRLARQLRQFGYQPLDPLAATLLTAAQESIDPTQK